MKSNNTSKRSTTSNLNAILAGLPKLARSCSDVRHCSRCFKPLTDPASWERGIGPICAKKDTHLFAKTIPANFAMATMHALNVDAATCLPETLREVWTALMGVLLEKTERATNGADLMQFMISGEDCRLVVKVIDWMLSYSGIIPAAKRDLIAVVKHLGFIGLAGVLSGVSSTGAAELKFENGKLFLKGSMNKAGFMAMRSVPGIVLPKRRAGDSYEAPASQYEKFINLVMEFWPCFDGEIESIKTQCVEWMTNSPAQVVEQVQRIEAGLSASKPQAKVVIRSVVDDFTVSFKWIPEISNNIVAEIKKLPLGERRYDAATRTWAIRSSHRETVMNLLAEHYEVSECEGTQVTIPSAGTPQTGAPRRGTYRLNRNYSGNRYL